MMDDNVKHDDVSRRQHDMSRNQRPHRSQVLFILVLALLVASYVFQLVAVPETARRGVGNYEDVEGSLTWILLMLSAATIGALVERQQPRNRIAFVFSLGALLGALSLAGDQWAAYALVVAPGSAPGGTIGYYLSFPGLYACWAILGVLVPLMFPDGHLGSRFRRFVAKAGVLSAGFWSVSIFHPDIFESSEYYGNLPDVTNPLALPVLEPVVELVSAIGLFGLFGWMFLGIGSLIPRVFRARGMERQQMKIIAYTTVITVILLLAGANLRNLDFVEGTIFITIIDIISVALTVAIPASFGVAILRYRLYDIDVVINKSLVYALLTAALLASYLVVVVTLSRVLDPVTRDSDIAVAGSTLAVAALFRPVRTRVQAFIDRRFYRARYDARRALEEFGARLRDEIDIEAVRSDVLGLVQATLHPRHASLWIKPQEAR